MNEMTVQEFLRTEERNLLEFSHAWLSKMKENPNDYPSSLRQADWIEQYNLFCNEREGNLQNL